MHVKFALEVSRSRDVIYLARCKYFAFSQTILRIIYYITTTLFPKTLFLLTVRRVQKSHTKTERTETVSAFSLLVFLPSD
jgi:hypothetical protein